MGQYGEGNEVDMDEPLMRMGEGQGGSKWRKDDISSVLLISYTNVW